MEYKKHTLKLMIIVLLLPVFANAQDYHPFPEENAFWTVVEFDQQIWEWETYIYTIKGDTVLNNTPYKKIYRLNDIPDSDDTLKLLHSFIRQEIENKKVYFIRHYMGETTEKLGYDFDVEIGDTVHLPAFDYENIGDSVFVLIDPIFDSTQLNNGEYRKNYFYNSIYPNIDLDPYVIEGIGTQRTPFPNLLFYDPFHQSTMYCLEVEGIHIYGDTTPFSFCGFTVGVSNYYQSTDFILYPIPVNDLLYISFPFHKDKTVSMQLFNGMGTYILGGNFNSFAKEYPIDVSFFPSGIYYLRILYDNNYLTKKIIINH